MKGIEALVEESLRTTADDCNLWLRGGVSVQCDRGHYCVPIRRTAQIVTQSEKILSSSKLYFTLKMPNCCLNLLLLPCGRSSPLWWGGFQGGHGGRWRTIGLCARSTLAIAETGSKRRLLFAQHGHGAPE